MLFANENELLLFQLDFSPYRVVKMELQYHSCSYCTQHSVVRVHSSLNAPKENQINENNNIIFFVEKKNDSSAKCFSFRRQEFAIRNYSVIELTHSSFDVKCVRIVDFEINSEIVVAI